MSEKRTIEIEEKLRALEDISGLLDDLTPEQRKRFDEAVSRRGVKHEPVVTMDEIDGLIVEWMGLLNPQKMCDVLKDFFKSKDMEVRSDE